MGWFILGNITGAILSYWLSDTLQQRWQKVGATYAWMNENEKRFYTYLSQYCYQLYLSGDLKKMIENAKKAENILEPPEEYVREKEAEILARMAMERARIDTSNFEPRNVTPGGGRTVNVNF